MKSSGKGTLSDGRCFVDNQTQKKMYKGELSEGPYGIV
jgi:hypothetical protein